LSHPEDVKIPEKRRFCVSEKMSKSLLSKEDPDAVYELQELVGTGRYD
jgi:hypothetical protein